jgi:hypothetical protein
MKKEPPTAQYPTFYVDDSACEIAGRKHVVLGALTFPDEHEAIADWLRKKREFRLHPYDEVKWNDRAVPLEQRRAFVPFLNKAVGIVVIMTPPSKPLLNGFALRFGGTAMKRRRTDFGSDSTKT